MSENGRTSDKVSLLAKLLLVNSSLDLTRKSQPSLKVVSKKVRPIVFWPGWNTQYCPHYRFYLAPLLHIISNGYIFNNWRSANVPKSKKSNRHKSKPYHSGIHLCETDRQESKQHISIDKIHGDFVIFLKSTDKWSVLPITDKSAPYF